jgi:hypothetical protein
MAPTVPVGARVVAQPPVSSKAKDYSMDRPLEVQNELDDLRNRGLAKVLNRHFTDTTKKLAKEKAAADAALADLERRRANTSEFVPSKGGELNPYDSLYVELQQKRAECRRKERETMLLYQRYVHKFGKVAATAKPVVIRTPPNTATAAADADVSPAMSTPEAAPPPPSPVPLLRPTLEPLDENSETESVDPGISFSRFYNKRIHANRVDPPTKSAEQEVPELEDLTEQPSHDEHSGAVSCNDPPEHEVLRREVGLEALLKRDGSGQLLTIGRADPPTDAPATASSSSDPEIDDVPTPKASKTPIANDGESVEPTEKSEDVGLAKALFRSSHEPEETIDAAQPVEELPMQDDGAPSKVAPDRVDIWSDASDYHRPTREVTAAATTLSDTEDDSDDRSVISGLTMTSQVTKQVMEEIENEMTHFLNTETQAIRKMLDEEEERTPESSTVLNGSASVLGDETHAASIKAEALAREMQKILDEYKDESSSKAMDETDGVTVATVGYPKPYTTSDPTKNWKVYYDDKVRREYFYETNSNVTQWDPPDVVKSVATIDPSVFAVDVSPRPGFKKTVSRRDMYRKKIRKRRMRRLAVVSLFTLGTAATVYHWQRNHSEKSYPEAMIASWQSASVVVGQSVDFAQYALADAAETLKDALESMLSDPINQRKSKKLSEEQEQSRLPAEREAGHLEARRLQLQKEKDVAEEKGQQERLLEVERQREQELQAKLEIELKLKTETEALIQQEAKMRADQELKALERPIACYLPLASHIHPRCRKLAKLKPMFKDTDILNSFLQ